MRYENILSKIHLHKIFYTTGFDGIITRLQMKTYLIISDFVYHIDKKGIPSGWGTACYTTPEKKFGVDFTLRAYKNEPQKSKKKMLEFLAGRLHSAPAKEISNVIA